MSKQEILKRIGELKWSMKWTEDTDEWYRMDMEVYELNQQLKEMEWAENENTTSNKF